VEGVTREERLSQASPLGLEAPDCYIQVSRGGTLYKQILNNGFKLWLEVYRPWIHP
jgi:hypothetical protein